MSDLIDRAAEEEALFLAEALSKHPAPKTTGSYSHCEDCGGPIPEARRKAVPGCTRCIVCQTYLEEGFLG